MAPVFHGRSGGTGLSGGYGTGGQKGFSDWLNKQKFVPPDPYRDDPFKKWLDRPYHRRFQRPGVPRIPYKMSKFELGALGKKLLRGPSLELEFFAGLLPNPFAQYLPGFNNLPLWKYDWANYGYSLCWGQDPNCLDPAADAMGQGGARLSCLSQATFECLAGQPYDSPKSVQFRNGDPITLSKSLGILIGWRHDLTLGRYRLHQHWRSDWTTTVSTPITVPPLGTPRRGHPLPWEWEHLPDPEPERGPLTSSWHKRQPPPRDPPTQVRPGPRTRERKHFEPNYAKWKALADALGGLGEFGDAVTAVYKALPWKYQDWKNDRTPQAKLRTLWKHMRDIDLAQAVDNLIKQELSDRAIGKAGSAVKKAFQDAANHGYWPGQFGPMTGPGV